MPKQLTIQDIELLEASIDSMFGDLKRKAAKLREMLEGVSTPSTTRKGLSKEQQSKLLTRRRTTIIKKRLTNQNTI